MRITLKDSFITIFADNGGFLNIEVSPEDARLIEALRDSEEESKLDNSLDMAEKCHEALKAMEAMGGFVFQTVNVDCSEDPRDNGVFNIIVEILGGGVSLPQIEDLVLGEVDDHRSADLAQLDEWEEQGLVTVHSHEVLGVHVDDLLDHHNTL